MTQSSIRQPEIRLRVALVSIGSKLAAAAEALCRTLIAEPHAYRPELHYMRGPGPKWRAKNGPPSGQS